MKNFSDDEIKYIISEFSKGLPISVLCKKFGISRDPIYRVLKKNNVKRRSAKEQKLLDRFYSHDENYFNKIDTSNKAYILGFMLADGCLVENGSALKIKLHEKDVDFLEFFRKETKSNNPIRMYKKKGGETVYPETLIRSDVTFSDLVKHSCTPRKSLTLVFPSLVDEVYYGPLIRGYFDGDGCASIDLSRGGGIRLCANFTTTSFFAEKLKEIFDKIGIKSTTRSKIKNNLITVSLDIKDDLSIFKLYKFMYNSGDFSLKRKKDKFFTFFQEKYKIINSNKSVKNKLTKNIKFKLFNDKDIYVLTSAELKASSLKLGIKSVSKIYECKKYKNWNIEKIEEDNTDGIEFLNWLNENF